MTLSVKAHSEAWPIAGSFVISRGARTEVRVVVAEVSDGVHTGRAECVPYPRYGETVEGVLAEIAMAELTGDREALRSTIKPGAARNALDCALWDLEAKRAGKPAWVLAGLPEPRPVVTCYTLSLGSPESMAEAARKAAGDACPQGEARRRRRRGTHSRRPRCGAGRAPSWSTPTRRGAKRISPSTCAHATRRASR